ncbi:hypothetical protein [Agromyces sp. SYSU T00194]|uniref:hypothetical protein n=1 Tax=Agromyces chitinivorans TaxID=3158560 RepID=UPI00339721FC
MKTEEPERLLKSTAGVIHLDGCPTMRHSVDGRVPVVHWNTDIRDGEMYQWKEVEWKDCRVERAAVERGDTGRYRTCIVCAPTVDAWTPPPPQPKFTSRSAGSLHAGDIGRHAWVGVIESIRHSATGTEIAFSHPSEMSLELSPDDEVTFYVKGTSPFADAHTEPSETQSALSGL